MKTTTNEKNVPATKEEKNLVLNGAFFKNVGIAVDLSADGVKAARESLRANGATALPAESDTSANTALAVMATVQNRIMAERSAARDVSILLASMDASKEYAKITDPNGKAYTSTLALAKAWFPRLEHSTLAGYIGAGRDCYLPAAQGKFGKKAGDAIAAMPANTLVVLKGALKAPDKSAAVVAAIRKNPAMTKKAAQELVKQLNGNGGERTPRTADESAANTAAANAAMSAADMYATAQAVVKDALLSTRADGEIHVVVTESGKAALKRLMQEGITADDANAARAVLRAVMHGIFG